MREYDAFIRVQFRAPTDAEAIKRTESMISALKRRGYVVVAKVDEGLGTARLPDEGGGEKYGTRIQ